MDLLEDSWRRVTGGRARLREWMDLVCRYSGIERHYHTLEHIRDMLQGLPAAIVHAGNPALHRAIWWHDAVYDSTRSDNEERSAELAVETMTRWNLSPDEIARTGALILITKRHEVPANDPVAQTLVDLDLAILAAFPEKYDLYAVHVRAEYDWVSASDYARGRGDFLRRMLARDRIFTDPFREATARANMTRELSRWQS
jgi:predicted metal-dependent HD superfamily phosphohydrolase